jgi:lipooligosaccharide transport system ATP-binding protein
MDKAKIAAEGSPAELIAQHSTKEVVELRFPVGEQAAAVAKLEGIATRVEELPDRVLLYTANGDATTTQLAERGIHPETTVVRRSTLEDVFLRLTGRTLIE